MDFFKISPTLSYQLLENEMILGKGTKQKIITNLDLISEILTFIKTLNNQTVSKKEITNWLKECSSLNWKYIKNNDFLINSNFDLNSNYSRNEMFWNYKFNDISLIKDHENILFVIWGCGGIGTSIGFFLASMGFKKFILIDKDKIEKTNLNRQFLFSKQDIGSEKTEILKRELEKRFDDLQINLFRTDDNLFLEKLNKKLDNDQSLIILSADEDDCVSQSTSISNTKKIPLLNVGYLNDISTIGPFCLPSDNDSSCLLCNSEITTDYGFGKFNFLPNKAPSWMGNNTQAVLIAIREILIYLKKQGDKKYLNSFNQRIGIDCLTLKRYFLPMPRNENCINHFPSSQNAK